MLSSVQSYSSIGGAMVSPRKKLGLLPNEIEWLKEFMSVRGNPLKLTRAIRVHPDTVKNGLESNSYEFHVAQRLKTFITLHIG